MLVLNHSSSFLIGPSGPIFAGLISTKIKSNSTILWPYYCKSPRILQSQLCGIRALVRRAMISPNSTKS